MANYVAICRSNYFKVVDENNWIEFCERMGVESVVEWSTEYQCNLYGFLVPNGEGIPVSIWNEDINDSEDVDFVIELSHHLPEDWVAIIMEVGFEKMRYLIGYALAVNHFGEQELVALDTIYDQAKNLGKNITLAEY